LINEALDNKTYGQMPESKKTSLRGVSHTQ